MTLTYTQSCPAVILLRIKSMSSSERWTWGGASPRTNWLQYRLRSSPLYHSVTGNQRILVCCLCRPRPYRLCIGTLAFGGYTRAMGWQNSAFLKRSLLFQKYVIMRNAETLAYILIICAFHGLSLNWQFNAAFCWIIEVFVIRPNLQKQSLHIW